MGDKIAVLEGRLEGIDCTEQFDVVTFLNVLHHVTASMQVMKKLAGLCKGTLIVAFRQPVDNEGSVCPIPFYRAELLGAQTECEVEAANSFSLILSPH